MMKLCSLLGGVSPTRRRREQCYRASVHFAHVRMDVKGNLQRGNGNYGVRDKHTKMALHNQHTM